MEDRKSALIKASLRKVYEVQSYQRTENYYRRVTVIPALSSIGVRE